MTEAILTKSTRGSLYNIGVAGATIVLGFIRTLLLMRLLTPDQFGTFALPLALSTFALPFTNLGIDSALLQKKDPQPAAFSTNFVLRVGFALAVLLLFVLAAPLLRLLYSAQVVLIFLILLAVNVVDASYGTPGIILRREMRFGSLALLNLVSSIAMTFTSPLLAYLGAGVWSLVVEDSMGSFVRWAGTWLVLRPWRISLRFDRQEAVSQVRFGVHVMSSQLLGNLLDRFDDFWTGTVLGSTALGYYSRAYDLAQYPERVLATPVTNVFISTYSALQDQKKELSQAFFRSSSFLIRAGFWLNATLLVAAPDLIYLLFGSTWLPAVPLFRLMLVYIILDPIYINLSYLVIGAGQPVLLTRVRIVQVVIFVVAVILGAALGGTSGVALAADLMMLSGAATLFIFSRQFVSYSLGRMFAWPTLAGIVATALGWLGAEFLPSLGLLPVHSTWLGLAVKIISISLLYLGILFAGERETFREYGQMVVGLVRQKPGEKHGG